LLLSIRHLARNPDFQNELRENPKLITEATEELLELYRGAVTSDAHS